MKKIIIHYYAFWIGLALIVLGVLELVLKGHILIPFPEDIQYLQTSSAYILAGVGCVMFALIPTPWELKENAMLYTTLFVIALLFIAAATSVLFL